MSARPVWLPTAAHTRAALAAMALGALAVGLRRPELLVLATPLVIAAAAGAAARPRSAPTIREWIDHTTLREGQATAYHVRVEDSTGAVETVAAVHQPQRWMQLRPEHGQVAATGRDHTGARALDIVVRPTRWGNFILGRALTVATSPWGAYRWLAPRDGATSRLAVLPGTPDETTSTVSQVASPGLVGSHRSPRHGSGTEFASIRPFTAGDRLNRISWPRSLRSGTLQVASTWADQDRHIVLLVDALDDVGRSSGIDGTASSLDITVRATAALAADHIGRGDRVSLVTVGSRRHHRLPPAAGDRHLRRILAALASIEPAGMLFGPDKIPKNLGRGSMVVLLSSLRSPWALTRAVSMTAQGLLVVVVDCLPTDLERHGWLDEFERAAWRIERLRREDQVRRALELGVAVVPWRGSSDLDAVIRDLHRRRHVRRGWSA